MGKQVNAEEYCSMLREMISEEAGNLTGLRAELAALERIFVEAYLRGYTGIVESVTTRINANKEEMRVAYRAIQDGCHQLRELEEEA